MGKSITRLWVKKLPVIIANRRVWQAWNEGTPISDDRPATIPETTVFLTSRRSTYTYGLCPTRVK